MFNGKHEEPDGASSKGNENNVVEAGLENDNEEDEEEISEEVQSLCAEMDAINAALDKIERQTDLINSELRNVLTENKKEREEANLISEKTSDSEKKS